jgi:hypothetical protein
MSRTSMAALIARVRDLINDPAGVSEVWTDDQIQNVMDESRLDIVNQEMTPKITYNAGQALFLNYYTAIGNWEDDYVIKQYLYNTVSPNTLEPIAGHFAFNSTTLPPLYITGKQHDIYRSAADLLERWAAKSLQQFAFSSDSQSFQPQQVVDNISKLVRLYRSKQQPRTISMTRSDLNAGSDPSSLTGNYHNGRLIDYLASGNKG